MRRKNLAWLSLIFVLVMGLAASNVAYAPVTVAELYVDPPEVSVGVGEWFTVDVSIVDVVDLYAYGIKVQWNTMVLTCNSVTEITTFMNSPDGTAFVGYIYNVQGFVDVGVTLLGAGPGVNGDGPLFELNFTVVDSGKSDLDIYYGVLLDSTPEGAEISHTTVDGYFYSTQAANLVQRSAWPEKRHFVVVKEGPDYNNTLYGKVRNLGPTNLYVYVEFSMVRDDGLPVTVTSSVVTLTPLGTTGDTQVITADFGSLTGGDVGKYAVNASCYYSFSGIYWTQGDKIKTFSFAVV